MAWPIFGPRADTLISDRGSCICAELTGSKVASAHASVPRFKRAMLSRVVRSRGDRYATRTGLIGIGQSAVSCFHPFASPVSSDG